MKEITNVLWSIAIVLLLGGGIYFSVKLKFPQFHFVSLFKGFRGDAKSSVSPFKSLSMSLAARIGVGSLAGISLAIYLGGPGTIFWIWVSGLFTAVNAFCESYLGIQYQKKDGEAYKGGPPYYICEGLGKPILAKIYAILIIVAYIVGFMSIQANTITTALHQYYGISSLLIGMILAIFCAFSIVKGLNRIVNITSKLVPIMGLGYILLSFFVILWNWAKIPQVLYLIFSSAFSLSSISGGIISTFIIGIQRGVFSTEAGLGTGAIASSCSHSSDKISLSLIQILGIYFTVFVVCTSTAILILTTDYTSLIFHDINGIELTQYALNYHLGSFGIIVLMLCVISLAYSTIVAGYYYGESSLKYLFPKAGNNTINLLKIITISLLFWGSIARSSILWSIVDLLVAILAIINMYSLFAMRKEIIDDYRLFQKKKKV